MGTVPIVHRPIQAHLRLEHLVDDDLELAGRVADAPIRRGDEGVTRRHDREVQVGQLIVVGLIVRIGEVGVIDRVRDLGLIPEGQAIAILERVVHPGERTRAFDEGGVIAGNLRN